MSILKVARMGHPILRVTTEPLTRSQIRSTEIQRLIDDMLETMREYVGVGLAAPQVHSRARMAVIELPAEKDAEAAPPTILANPFVTPLDDTQDLDWESCLSIPDLHGLVARAQRIRVEALDRQARAQVFEADGFLARVIQHECDHLDGVLYVDRMHDLRSLSFTKEYQRYVAHTTADEEE
jgi:peptide deformylase